MVAENIGEQVIERPNGTRLIKSVYQDRKGFYAMLDGKRQRLADKGKVVDSRGKKVYEFSMAGRPRIYADRRNFTIEISIEVAEALDRARGNRSKAAFVEEVFRSNPEIAAILGNLRNS